MSVLCGLQVMGEYSALAREGALLQAWKAQGQLGVQVLKGIHPSISIFISKFWGCSSVQPASGPQEMSAT